MVTLGTGETTLRIPPKHKRCSLAINPAPASEVPMWKDQLRLKGIDQ
jgi:hypothetical protein